MSLKRLISSIHDQAIAAAGGLPQAPPGPQLGLPAVPQPSQQPLVAHVLEHQATAPPATPVMMTDNIALQVMQQLQQQRATSPIANNLFSSAAEYSSPIMFSTSTFRGAEPPTDACRATGPPAVADAPFVFHRQQQQQQPASSCGTLFAAPAYNANNSSNGIFGSSSLASSIGAASQSQTLVPMMEPAAAARQISLLTHRMQVRQPSSTFSNHS